ncbi:MAG: hypothetical protein WBO35_04695 [Candidatus Saccharimonadales bacterium]
MNAMLTLDSGEALMGDDTPKAMPEYGKEPCSFSISLNGENAEELRGQFALFAQGGTIQMPLEKQMWGDEFGMVTDKFGINWMVNIHG